jgi:hypothetical protein
LRRPRTSRGSVACRVLAGWGPSGWAGIRRVGGPSAAPRPPPPGPFGPPPPRPFGPPPPRPFGPLVPRPPGTRPSQPASRPRGPESRGSGTPRPASRRGAGLAPGGILGGTAPGGLPATRPAAGGGPGTRPRGLAPDSPPYGLLGRVSRHRGSLIGASDVSRCGLVTGTRR